MYPFSNKNKEDGMRLKISFLVMLFLFTSTVFPSDQVKKLSLSAKGISELDIDCGAGFLKVYGREGLKEIKVEAEIVVKGGSAKKVLQKYVKLSLKKRGRSAVLISQIDWRGSSSLFKSAVINLTVTVPKNMDLIVDDGSGSMEIAGITGDLKVDDGSGSMEIKDITGDLDVEDGSGSMKIEGIEGDVDIDDGSGKMDARDIQGDISIKDGSGTIYIRDIGGNVTVRDGSGSINIDGVEKNVTILRSGSGGLNIKNVKGKVTTKD
jgi:DUF4097 and DUF4098 domain-containing protein YvlB